MHNVDKNIMLYWDDTDPDVSVLGVVETWRAVCPDWNVTLFSKDTGREYLRMFYGRAIEEMFLSCAIPAMRSDFFRVFWALREGGIYSDLTFCPKREPLFFSGEKNITVVRWFHGRIVNGLFHARKDARELKLIAFEMMKRVSLRAERSVWSATGPGMWIETIGQEKTETMDIVDQNVLLQKFIKRSNYHASTRNKGGHWSELQKTSEIFL